MVGSVPPPRPRTVRSVNNQAIEQLELARARSEFDLETRGGWSLSRAEPSRYVAARDHGSGRQYEHGYDLKELVHRVKERTRMTASIPRL